MSIKLLSGDCRDVLKQLPDNSIHCCVSSPPYYGLRSYGVGVENGEIGSERSPDEYLAVMVGVYRQVRRVLRDDATCWINLGDSYNNFRAQMGPGQALHGRDDLRGKPAPDSRRRGWDGLKEKDLLMMPARLALALQADGWWLRSQIVWAKPNPMPESVTDRPTSAYEMVYLLTKRSRYYYDNDAIAEPAEMRPQRRGVIAGKYDNWTRPVVRDDPSQDSNGTRACRNVWTIATAPYSDAHFATFPPALAERCIRAGTSERGACSQCGAPWARAIERETRPNWRGEGQKHDGTYYRPNIGGVGNDARARVDNGWSPSCRCGTTETRPCVVLDPFFGAGTTGLVADRLGRDCIGIDLNPDYNAMSRARIEADCPLFTSFPPAETDAQDERMRDLFREAAD